MLVSNPANIGGSEARTLEHQPYAVYPVPFRVKKLNAIYGGVELILLRDLN
jgi:hypothetical protein